MEIVIKAITAVIALAGLLYTGIASRRNGEKHQLDMIKAELELLRSLEPGSELSPYCKIRRKVTKRIDSNYRDFKSGYPVYFRAGLYIFSGFSVLGYLLLVFDYHFLLVCLAFFVAIIGFAVQNRALTPRMSGEPEPVALKEK